MSNNVIISGFVIKGAGHSDWEDECNVCVEQWDGPSEMGNKTIRIAVEDNRGNREQILIHHKDVLRICDALQEIKKGIDEINT